MPRLPRRMTLLPVMAMMAAAMAEGGVKAQTDELGRDTDGDGLVEISNLEQLYSHIRDRCRGYDVCGPARPQDFDDPTSYPSGRVNTAWTKREGGIP